MKKIFQISLIIAYASIFQSCSWKHTFAIQNNTDQTWTIEYEISDKRGVFQQKIYLYGKDKNMLDTLEFQGSLVSFELPPGATARIGAGRNTKYRHYSKYSEVNPEIPWMSFVNIKYLTLRSGDLELKQEGTNLKDWLHKNKATLALIKLEPLMSFPSISP